MDSMGKYKTEWGKEGYLAIDHLLSAEDLIKLRYRFDEFARQSEGLRKSTDRFKMTIFESIPDPSAIQGNALQMVAEPHELCSEVMDLARKIPGVRPLDGSTLDCARYIEDLTALILNLNRKYKGHAMVKFVGI